MSTAVSLTPGQRGLWFLNLVQPADTAYNGCVAIELLGPLRLAALRTAVRHVGLRHDTLRARFTDGDDGPRQVIHPQPPPLHLVDLSRRPDTAWAGDLDRLLVRLAGAPFDLRRGAVRWLLVRCGDERHVLVLDVHHIVFDRDSLAVVCRDLADQYAACRSGSPPMDGPAVSDTRAVAAAWRPDPGAAEGLSFWRAELAGAPADVRAFPGRIDATADAAPIRYTVRYRHDELWQIARLCAAANATPFMAVLALVAGLISRYTGRAEVTIGAPVSLRGAPGSRDAVGLLVNVLPFRVRVAPRASFRTLLRQVRTTVLDALEHRDVPLADMVRVVGGLRSSDENPLFQTLLAYQREAAPPRLPGLRTVVRPIPAAAAKYQLSVTATEAADGLTLDVEADGRYHPVADLTAWSGQLTRLLRAAGQDPDAPIAGIELSDTAEQELSVGPRVPRDRSTSLHGLASSVVRRAPEAVAVVAVADRDRCHLSYGAMYRTALVLARALRARGAGVERTIAVLQKRGIGMPVSYLAVLLAGGAVVPLEPDDPDARLTRLLADSGVRLVIGHRDALDRYARLGVPALAIEDFLVPARDGAAPVVDPAPVHPEQAAYVLFTSGSSGEPKGVAVPHRGIVNRVRWMQETLPLRAGERVLFKTAVSFDVSVAEMFWPLVAGGCLVVAEPGGERDPQYLSDMITRERLAYIHFVPSMLAPFLAEVEARGTRLPTLRLVACSGEALPDELSRRAGALLDGELHNLYGPTEASVEVLHWPCDRAGRRPVALGRPISNTECRVLDDWLRPVPRLAVGELCLGGECLARGYLGRPGLTAASFVPAPESEPGRRLYRTGDYGYRTADGAVHLVGRHDHQVKVLGRRVELGEVSEAFRRQRDVQDAAVVLRGNKLVAFVVPVPGAEPLPAPSALLGVVRAHLPAYMVPALVEFLPELPITRNGKVDLRDLTRRAADLSLRPTTAMPPHTDLERRLAASWCAVLGVPEVGVHDGFFDAGGDSVTLVQLHRRLVADVAPELTVRDLFRFPTVAALAEHLDGDAGPAQAAVTASARAHRRRMATSAFAGRAGHG